MSDRRLASVEEVCTKTFPLDTIGDELPRPGIGVFQRVLDAVMATGTSLSGAVPRPSGPRNRVQSAATTVGVTRASTRKASRGGYMVECGSG